MKDRKFGVELEFAAMDQGVYWVESEIRKLGLNVLNDWYRDDRHNYWSVHEDGSEIELGSRILQGKEGFDELKYVMDHFTKQGCYVTSSDGLHIHHDAPDYLDNQDAIIKLVDSWNDNRDAIYRMVNPDRWQRYACSAWEDSAVQRLKKGDGPGNFGRYDLNIRSLAKYGTIEIRLHEGTLDYSEAEAWIKFGQMFLNSVAKRKFRIPIDENSKMLLRRVKMPRTQAKVLERKAELVRGQEVVTTLDYRW